jgi:hypothetical protein
MSNEDAYLLHPNGVTRWKLVTDDFGDRVSVTEIFWPNRCYYRSIQVQRYWKQA